MSTRINRLLVESLRMLLKPAVRFCYGRSLRVQDLLEAAKVLFVEVAHEELKKEGSKVTMSRVSNLSGVHRIDVARILKEGGKEDVQERVASRVMQQWRKDRRFVTKSGRPKVLTFKGPGNEFAELVGSVSKDPRPTIVLEDLERVGAIQKTQKGIKLLSAFYVPREDIGEGYRMIARDASDLMNAAVDNLNTEGDPPNYHISVIYDNIDEGDIPKIRDWFDTHCYRFHERAQTLLSKYDLDLNPDENKTGGKRIALGIYTKTT